MRIVLKKSTLINVVVIIIAKSSYRGDLEATKTTRFKHSKVKVWFRKKEKEETSTGSAIIREICISENQPVRIKNG